MRFISLRQQRRAAFIREALKFELKPLRVELSIRIRIMATRTHVAAPQAEKGIIVSEMLVKTSSLNWIHVRTARL